LLLFCIFKMTEDYKLRSYVKWTNEIKCITKSNENYQIV